LTTKLLALTACFVLTGVLGARGLQPERVPLRESLSTLPLELGAWQGTADEAFDDEIVRVLGVDEYVNRVYSSSAGHVGLYIGYYESQREGDTIHSPMNCLPGAGWQPVETGRSRIGVPGMNAAIEVNRVVIQKGLDRQIALYWYQSHGRVVASEYWSKIFMVYDAARLNRSDAALIRVISPIRLDEAGPQGALARSVAFVQALFPALSKHLPS
jgi:EpsI family protein